jgi:hypothetical protein
MKFKKILLPFLILILTNTLIQGQKKDLLQKEDLVFLKQMVKDVMDSSRIYPNQIISDNFGPNQTGGILIRPGGRNSYPAFWIRDYAMSIQCGFVTQEEQKHMLLLTAKTQSDEFKFTKWGSFIPKGAVADHIRIDDGKPIYFPGTYSYENQGDKKWGMQPPFCDQFFFIQMAFDYVTSFSAFHYLNENINGIRLLDRLELAYQMPPIDSITGLIEVNVENRGVDFGFRDAIYITGKLCFASLLKYQASLQLALLFQEMGDKKKALMYKNEATKIKKSIIKTFKNKDGMLFASTETSAQADVWATSLAIHFDVLRGNNRLKAAKHLLQGYISGELSQNGNIRHILKSDDFNENSSWEKSLVPKDTYQNGAYWGTPVGWVCKAIAYVDQVAAQKLASEYIQDLREGDFRKGGDFGAPWECINGNAKQNSVYLTSVAVPFIIFNVR